MKRTKIISAILAVFLLTALFPGIQALNHVNPFSDITDSAWYYDDVLTANEMGLFNGKPDNTFDPYGNLTLSQAIKLAACMHEYYHTGSVTLVNGTKNWYDTYVDYAVENEIISSSAYDGMYDATATRAQLVKIFYYALPESQYTVIQSVPDDAIPDVSINDSFGNEVYAFYRAGILQGNDAYGTFAPDSSIMRCEVAVIITRMIDPDTRITDAYDWYGCTAPEIINGSFEEPDDVESLVTRGNLFSSAEVPGWTVVSAGDQADGSAGVALLEIQTADSLPDIDAADGTQYAELDGNNSVCIYQDIETCPDQTYSITFAYSPRTGEGVDKLLVTWNGNHYGPFQSPHDGPFEDTVYEVTGDAAEEIGNGWRYITINHLVPSDGATTRLEFTEVGESNGYGMLLDDVSIDFAS